jgi:hypothetical protein
MLECELVERSASYSTLRSLLLCCVSTTAVAVAAAAAAAARAAAAATAAGAAAAAAAGLMLSHAATYAQENICVSFSVRPHTAAAATVASAAAAGLMLSSAATYAPKNIRVNCVAPGLTRTPLAERITSNAAALKASEGMHALKR